jgi:cytochrome P450
MKKRAMVNVLKNIVSARMKLANDVKASSIAKAGSRQSAYGSDVLGMMLEAMNEGNSNMTASQVLDECTVFFLATDSPTSLLLMWSLMLLAQNPDWQQRARSEVQEVLGAEATPQVDKLANLKLVPTNPITETLSYTNCMHQSYIITMFCSSCMHPNTTKGLFPFGSCDHSYIQWDVMTES